MPTVLNCSRCRTPTEHTRTDDGAYWCMRCLANGAYEQEMEDERPRGGGLMLGTIKFAGFIVALTFLIGLGTCAYVCTSHP